MKLRENFLELCIEEVYSLIIDENHWPTDFSNEMKLQLLNRIQQYYEKKDTVSAYNKCAKLQKHIEIYQYETTGSLTDILN